MENRNYIVDILRFIAVTWVALFHFNETTAFQHNWYRLIVKHGHLGVPIFFVISGYCIALSANHSTSVKDFLVRRFFRIYPIYWISLLIVLLAVATNIMFYGVNSVAQLPQNPFQIGTTLLALTSPLTDVRVINWVYWSLTVELIFYAIIGLYILLKEKYRFIWISIISILPFFYPYQEKGFLFFVQYWPAFLLGFAAYHMFIRQDLKNMFLILLSIVTLALSIHSNYFKLACIITVIIIIYGSLRPIKSNFISSIGNYSYAIYLIHVPIGVHIFGYFRQFKLMQQNMFFNILIDLSLFVLILLIAKLMYLKIELPLINYGKKYFTKGVAL